MYSTCTVVHNSVYSKLSESNLRLLLVFILQPIFRFSIRGLPVSDEAEFDNLTAIFTELRLSVNIKVLLAGIYMYM